MRTIIAGSRTITDYARLERAMSEIAWNPSVVLSGTAKGADQLGERWAVDNGKPLERWPAEWRQHGKRAGYMRNVKMAFSADALVALWDGKSRGTAHMVKIALDRGLLVAVFNQATSTSK